MLGNTFSVLCLTVLLLIPPSHGTPNTTSHHVAAKMYRFKKVAGCVTRGVNVSITVPDIMIVATTREPQRRPITSPCKHQHRHIWQGMLTHMHTEIAWL